MPGRKSDTELDDLNLHVKSPLANDLASRFGREYVDRPIGIDYGSGGERVIGDNLPPCGWLRVYCRPGLGSGLARESADGAACPDNDLPAGARANVAPGFVL